MEELQEEIIQDKKPWYHKPIKVIVGIFLLLLIIMMVVPFYGIKTNPEPNYLPKIEELNLPKMDIPKVDSNDIRAYVQVNPEIKQLADQIVTLSCQNPSKVCNAKALFYFVQENFNYVNDPLAFEYYKTPQESLQSHAGDCDDSSILLSSLLQAVGLPTRFIFVPHHVYIQVRIPEAISSYKDDNNWINLDPTCTGCKFGEIHYSYNDAEKSYWE